MWYVLHEMVSFVKVLFQLKLIQFLWMCAFVLFFILFLGYLFICFFGQHLFRVLDIDQTVVAAVSTAQKLYFVLHLHVCLILFFVVFCSYNSISIGAVFFRLGTFFMQIAIFAFIFGSFFVEF